MVEISWIKLSVNIFDDEKMKLIDEMPENDAIFRIWVYLLSLAGKTNDSGLVYLSNHIPYTDEMISALCNRPVSTVRLALKTFRDFGLIEIYDNNMIGISNWEKHQNIDGMEKIRKLNAERNKKYRERKKLLENSDVSVTSRDATEEDKNKSKNKKKSNNAMSDKSDDVIPYSEILDYLNKKTSRSFRNVEANKKLIRARWNEGYKLDDFKAVIDNMVVNWSGKNFNGVPAENYLQPKTLFSNKFDSYLNQTQIKSTSDKVVKSAPNWSNQRFEKDEETMTAEEFEEYMNGLDS
ncbi:phage replisome organizer N-terminal domain-containing protein [Lactococcus lactis]|uniref:Replication protein n=4 Tax=Lactococcus lactis TaxID=1358 RepID=A0A3S3M6L0_9LACT|nr:phage replisome organizer N-terminal domain-containing protein [Lactococcus lactis]NYZ58374.1 phage replisome organizer N-terminal domain-containing protein [Lactococcus lactis]RWR48640.1 replication protein [Lactococcus lactis]